LDISKIEAGQMELNLEWVELQPELDLVIATAEGLVEKNKNKLVCSCSEDVGLLYTDAQRLRKILLNLLGNAAKFTDQGTIEFIVRTESVNDEKKVIFELRDTGIGMSQEQLERIFDRFVQADSSTTRRFGGTGLGLGLVKEFSELLGGEIPVTSEENKGSCFSIAFSGSACNQDNVQPDSEKYLEPMLDVAMQSSSQILIIEDDPN